jgi:hypothetical protein
MRQIIDASAESLIPFVEDSVTPGSVIHTDGWLGYLPLAGKGYKYQVHVPAGHEEDSLGTDAASAPGCRPPQNGG